MLNVLFGTTVFVSVASLILALFMTRNFTSTHGKSQLFWSIGLWLFFIDALLEILFAIGAADQVLFDIYLFTVAILVQSLSIGSIPLAVPTPNETINILLSLKSMVLYSGTFFLVIMNSRMARIRLNAMLALTMIICEPTV